MHSQGSDLFQMDTMVTSHQHLFPHQWAHMVSTDHHNPLQLSVINHYEPIEHEAPKKTKQRKTHADSGSSPLPQFFFHLRCVVGARNGDLAEAWKPRMFEDSRLGCLGTNSYLKIGFVAVHYWLVVASGRVRRLVFLRLKLPYPKKTCPHSGILSMLGWNRTYTLVYVHPSSYGWIWMNEINHR